VAVVVAIDLAGDAATGSFRSSMETLAGKTDLEIAANGGVDERWMGRLASLSYNARFSPVMESQAVLPGIGAVPLYGLDFVAGAETGGGEAMMEAGTAVVSGALARWMGVKEGGTLTANIGGRAKRLTTGRVAGAGTAEFIAMDIAAAQAAIGRYGKLDRIDAAIAPGEDLAAVEKAVRALLPGSYLVRKPGARSDENQRMLRAFRWNLRVQLHFPRGGRVP
jgi:putative ABC transport system permease protein